MKLLSDTSPEARDRLIEHWRSVSPEEKARGRLNRAVLSLAQARQDAPDATPRSGACGSHRCGSIATP